MDKLKRKQVEYKELKEIELEACLFKISTDREGESKITFEVSRQFLAQTVSLNAFIEKRLKVKIEIMGDNLLDKL